MKSQPRLASVSAAADFLRRVEPRIDHDQLDLDLRVHGLRRQGIGVHPHHDLGHLERTDVADDASLRHVTGNGPLHRASFVEAIVVGRDIFGVFVAGAMLEFDVGILLGDFERLIHVAERGREDQLVALRGQVFDDGRRALVFGDVLDIVGDHFPFEMVDHGLAAFFMRPGPAEIADRAEIDVADLQRFIREGGAAHQRQCGSRRGGFDEIAPVQNGHL